MNKISTMIICAGLAVSGVAADIQLPPPIAMARTMIVDSATSQFFINLKDNAFLDHTAPNPRGYGYAGFGHVTKGMDVVDKIAQVKTGSAGYFQDVPVNPVVIKSVKIGE